MLQASTKGYRWLVCVASDEAMSARNRTGNPRTACEDMGECG